MTVVAWRCEHCARIFATFADTVEHEMQCRPDLSTKGT